MEKLHLGSGTKILKGWINVDLDDRYSPEVVHDLETFPYPFKDNTFSEILMDNILEHLKDTVAVMTELHRISKPGGIIRIMVPHCTSFMAMSHITHKKAFSSITFGTLEPESSERYSGANFRVLETKLIWLTSRDWFWIRPMKKIVDGFINIKPFFSERFLSQLLGGFDQINYKLKVLK